MKKYYINLIDKSGVFELTEGIYNKIIDAGFDISKPISRSSMDSIVSFINELNKEEGVCMNVYKVEILSLDTHKTEKVRIETSRTLNNDRAILRRAIMALKGANYYKNIQYDRSNVIFNAKTSERFTYIVDAKVIQMKVNPKKLDPSHFMKSYGSIGNMLK